ncbi:MAG: hypothetical protein ACT4QD_14755, partial [Acidobacteriota bacterium]
SGGAASEEGEAARLTAAFERVRTAPALALRRAEELSIVECPAVSGCEIVMEQRLVSPTEPAGVRYLHDVDVMVLLDLAPHCTQVPELIEAYNRRAAPVALPDFLTALAALIARGWLRWNEM